MCVVGKSFGARVYTTTLYVLSSSIPVRKFLKRRTNISIFGRGSFALHYSDFYNYMYPKGRKEEGTDDSS